MTELFNSSCFILPTSSILVSYIFISKDFELKRIIKLFIYRSNYNSTLQPSPTHYLGASTVGLAPVHITLYKHA